MEFIGTFFLVLTVGLTVVWPGAGALAPLAIGSALMIGVYSGGHISGGHHDPTVTLAAWMHGKCPRKNVIPYMATRLVAATVAAMNCQPVRLLFVKNREAEERLRPTLAAGNVDKTMAAPVTAIVAYDADHQRR